MAPRPVSTFKTTLPAFVDSGLESFLIEHKVEISAVPIQAGTGWASLLYGFGPALLIILGGGGFAAAKPFSEATGHHTEVQRIIDECHAEAKRLLGEHRRQLDALVAALLKRETLGEKEILEVTGLSRAPELESRRLDDAAATASKAISPPPR